MKLSSLFNPFKTDFYRYVCFLFGGGLSLIINLLITYALTEFFHLWHMASFALALMFEIIFLFIYHSLVTFKKKGKFLVFIFVILVISLLNWSFVYLFSEILGVYYLISIVVVAGLISLLNYLLNKKFVFVCD